MNLSNLVKSYSIKLERDSKLITHHAGYWFATICPRIIILKRWMSIWLIEDIFVSLMLMTWLGPLPLCKINLFFPFFTCMFKKQFVIDNSKFGPNCSTRITFMLGFCGDRAILRVTLNSWFILNKGRRLSTLIPCIS